MNKIQKAALIYWIGSIGQIGIVSACLFVLKKQTTSYPQILNLVFLILGGMSTALWGIIVSIKFNKKSVFNIFTDFFNFKKSVKSYLLVFGFIILLFGPQFAQNQINDNVYCYTFVILFLQSIIFGGIEEIGWRYTWQPIIEKKYSFVISCITTFFLGLCGIICIFT